MTMGSAKRWRVSLFKGKAERQFLKNDLSLSVVAPLEGCYSDDVCPDNMVCLNRQCVEVCQVKNPCDAVAACIGRNHEAKCVCPPGTEGTGRAPKGCKPSKAMKCSAHDPVAWILDILTICFL